MSKILVVSVCAVLGLIFLPVKAHALMGTSSADIMYKTASNTANPKMPMRNPNAASPSARSAINPSVIKDARKQQALQNIDTRLNQANVTQTQQWNMTLQKLTNVLTRISAQASMLQGQGQNTTSLNTSIKTAETAISNAQTAVSRQSQKEYIINVTSEATLRQNTLTVINQFKNDMRTTMMAVSTAKTAVANALEELIKLQVTETVPATNSGTLQ